MSIPSSTQQANLRDLAAVRQFFADMSHADVFRYTLNLNRHHYPTAPALAASTVVVCLDTEGWDSDSLIVKELGLNTFDSRDMSQVDTPGPWGQNLLRHIYFYFARILENAHYINRNNSAGDPNKNRFGQMRFLNDREIKDCLKEMFEWPLSDKGDGCVCPVVLLGHALDNDVDKMQKLLHFDPLVKGNLVKCIDTQVIARDVGHWTHPVNQIGLQRLVNEMGFEYRDPHTACNDAAMTTIAALQLVLDGAFKGPSQPKNLQEVVDEVERNSLSHDWHHGSPLYCFRCGARNHTREHALKGRPCRARVHCLHCEKDRPGSQYGHRTVVCVMEAFKYSNSSRPSEKKHRGRGATLSKTVEPAPQSGASTVPGFTQCTPAPTNLWAAIAASTPADGMTSSTIPKPRLTTLRKNKGKAPNSN